MSKKLLKFGLIAALLALFATSGFADTGVSGVVSTIGEADEGAKQTLRIAIQWIMGIGLPLICMVGFAFLGYQFAKKKAEQTQDGQNRIPMAVGVGIVIGIFVYMIVASLVGVALLGSAADGLKVITNFWATQVGLTNAADLK